MGKFVGLVGALTTLGAMAYLMAPLPPSETAKVATARPTPAPERVAPPEAVVPAAKPAPQQARRTGQSLVHQIQVELQRVGCYAGTIDGQWSEATQRAMQTLGEHVSVLRPVDTPDYIMLALARDQERGVCAPSQQRAASTRPLTSFQTTAASATKETPGAPGARRSSGPARAAASEPARAPRATTAPSLQSAVRGEIPQRAVELSSAEAARAAAARDELARIEQRAPVIQRPADERQASQSPTEPSPAQPSPATLENSRMGLGVANVDPLRAGIDPRDPNAPAILRGPPQPTPVTTARVGGPAEPLDSAPPAPQRPARVIKEIPPPTAKQTRRAWQRSIFNDMQRNGP